MSITAVVLEGARRAALYAALLFTFDASAQALSPAPRSVAAKAPASGAMQIAPLPIDGSIAESGLTLAAHHVDAHVVDGVATVRTRLLLRNDTESTIAAQYVLPHPARVARGDAWGVGASDAHLCDDDLAQAAAELAETAEAPARLAQRHDVLVVAPGEQITLEVEREMPLARKGAVHRLALPLPVDREAPWVPRFSADVFVEAERPIRRLDSPTHDVLVDGIGERSALLSVDGYVYRQTQLTVEFELDAPAPALARSNAAAR